MTAIDKFMGPLGEEFTSPFRAVGHTVIRCLPDLEGKKWDELTLAYIQALKPTYLRVTQGDIKCDARPGRVTVYVTADNMITKIEQEVMVGLPESCKHGADLDRKVRGLPESTRPVIEEVCDFSFMRSPWRKPQSLRSTYLFEWGSEHPKQVHIVSLSRLYLSPLLLPDTLVVISKHALVNNSKLFQLSSASQHMLQDEDFLESVLQGGGARVGECQTASVYVADDKEFESRDIHLNQAYLILKEHHEPTS